MITSTSGSKSGIHPDVQGKHQGKDRRAAAAEATFLELILNP